MSGRGSIRPPAALLALLALLCATRPLHAQAITRISVDSSGAQGEQNSLSGALSTDGRLVVFQSYAANLVAGDTNGVGDVFVHDLTTGTTTRVSVDSAGAQADGESEQPAISADGRFVAFVSWATNLVPGDANSQRDIFVHDLATGTTVRANVDAAGFEANDDSGAPSLSADGTIVAFGSFATNLVAGDTNGYPDVFVHDMVTGANERVSVDSAGGEGNSYSFGHFDALSDDGQVVVFESIASNLVAGDANGRRDVFVHDRTTGATTRVSVDSTGVEGDEESGGAVISGDGAVVAFESFATNLVAGDANGTSDVFIHDRRTALTERVSVDSKGVEGDKESFFAAISADGRFVAFTSYASNLVGNDSNRVSDVFLRDRAAGTTERMSVTDRGVEGDFSSFDARLSADGLTVAFGSLATNLVPNDTGDWRDVFVRIPCGTVASWTNYGAGFPGAFGVPTFTARANPVLGTTLVCDLGNSSGLYTVAFLVVGLQRADLPSAWGGHLLVAPFATQLLGLPPTGNLVGGDLPGYASLCGLVADLQALELDPGAAKGVSFTPGLELVLGR